MNVFQWCHSTFFFYSLLTCAFCMPFGLHLKYITDQLLEIWLMWKLPFFNLEWKCTNWKLTTVLISVILEYSIYSFFFIRYLLYLSIQDHSSYHKQSYWSLVHLILGKNIFPNFEKNQTSLCLVVQIYR